MQTVVLIAEDNHGQIGVAKDYPSAIDFLIGQHWLDNEYQVWVDNEISLNFTIAEHLGEDWQIIIRDEWDTEEFNNFFDDSFYLTIEDVYWTE